jgi:hypothetical protein
LDRIERRPRARDGPALILRIGWAVHVQPYAVSVIPVVVGDEKVAFLVLHDQSDALTAEQRSADAKPGVAQLLDLSF